MAVTHNITLVVNGQTVTMQSDLGSTGSSELTMNTCCITASQREAVISMMRQIGMVGRYFDETPITSLSIAAIE